jgi:hypothetical protein
MAVFCYDCSFLFLIQRAFRIVLVICLLFGTKKKKNHKILIKNMFFLNSSIYNLSLKTAFIVNSICLMKSNPRVKLPREQTEPQGVCK